MARNTQAHAEYMICLKAFTENKKHGNYGVTLAKLKEFFPKREDMILSVMQSKMYVGGKLFHGTIKDGGVAWYLQSHVACLNTSEFIEYYKQHNETWHT